MSSSERIGLEPGDDRRSFGITAMCRPCVSSARRVLGSLRTERDGCGTELVVQHAVIFGFLRCAAPRSTAREARRQEGRTSKGNKAQGRTGCGSIGNDRFASGLGGGATPRSRGSVQVGLRDVRRQRWMSEGLAGADANGKGATATVTWCGCRRGFFEGYEVRCEDDMFASHRRSACRSSGSGPDWPETQRTP